MEIFFIVGVSSLGVQQLVEILWDPVSTYFLRIWLSARGQLAASPTLFGFTEAELRTISNNGFASILGVLIAFLLPKARILAAAGIIRETDHRMFLDLLLSGLVIGAGTNGTNSLLKLAQYLKQRAGPLGGSGASSIATSSESAVNPSLHPLMLGSQETVSDVGPVRPPLDVPYQCQQCSNWCWAAIGSMVAQSGGEEESQCQVASRVLNDLLNVDCCAAQQNPTGCNVNDASPCNREARLEDALGVFLDGDQPGPIDATLIDQNINTRRAPFGCHIDLSNPAGSHFVLVVGFQFDSTNPQQSLVTVNDPDPTHGQWVDILSNLQSYRGQGTWDFTYFTSLQL